MSLIRPFVLISSPFTLAAIAAVSGIVPTQAQVIETNSPQQLAQVSSSQLEAKILHEVNRVRTNPARYAIWLESLRQYYNGMTLSLPGQPPLETQEGVGALDEAINELRQRRPVLPLVASDPLSRQAQSALTSSAPSGNSARLENSTVPIWAVMHLVVADGQRDRTARHNLLSIAHRSTGVACDTSGNLCSLSYDSVSVSAPTAVAPAEPIPVVPIAVEPIPVASIPETVEPPNAVAPEVAVEPIPETSPISAATVEPTPSEITATTLPAITTPEVTADPLNPTTPEVTVEPTDPPSSTLPSEVSIEPISPEIQPEITLEPIPEVTVEPSPEVVVEPTPEATAEPIATLPTEVTPETAVELTPETTIEPTPETTVTNPPETLPPPIEVAVEPTTPEISTPIPEDPLPELTTPIPEPNPQIVSLLNPDPQTLAQGYLLLSEGALEPNDQRYEDGSFYDEHLFQGGQGQSITINLSSNEFDTFLAVFDANGQQVLAQNDDAGGSSNSSVTMTLPYDGLYRIFVNGYNESDLGSYAISIK
ncbi:MAG: hypothetical protein F6J87_08805 [Spirulina sp. SIO3F2]|nr:hypothetical protein [Spirulina sp. SIO3F2]